MHGIAEAKGTALSVALITTTTSMYVNEQAEVLPCPRRGCKTSSWSGDDLRDSGLEMGQQERSHPLWSGKRVGATCAMPFGFGVKEWGLAYLMY